MMMGARNYDVILSVIGLSLLHYCIHINASGDCDPNSCLGPVYYYKELGCLPIYENITSCCPIRYNCDHWKNFPEDKCFANGHVYERGERLRQGDTRNPCYIWTCQGGEVGFEWSYEQCPEVQNSSCYFKRTPFHCCGTIEVCPEKEEDRPTCFFENETYKDGERMYNEYNECYCGEGYKDVNAKSFCISAKPSWCKNTLLSIPQIRKNCAPIYHALLTPNYCHSEFRCQQDNDIVFRHSVQSDQRPISENSEDPNMWCKLGNLTMSIGEKLSDIRSKYYITKCICEVPPIPTCRSNEIFRVD